VEAILSSLSSDTKSVFRQVQPANSMLKAMKTGFEGYNVKCVGYKSGSLAVQDMLNGNIDFVIIDEAPADSIVRAINELN